MATKRSGTMEEKCSTVMQAGVMEIQREIMDDFDADEVLRISSENDEDQDDEDEVGSDIEELDDDDLDDDDSDDDDLDEDDDED